MSRLIPALAVLAVLAVFALTVIVRIAARVSRYPTDTVMCSACNGTGEYDWNEIDIFSRCALCDGSGGIEVCAQCHDSGDECASCDDGPRCGEPA